MRGFQWALLGAVLASVTARPQQIVLSSDEVAGWQQDGSTSPTATPYRKLPWGDINIIATTDTHGWLAGHQHREADFSGDWGDFASFVSKMKAQAKAKGVDLLLVDSGDRVDGNGLVDAEPAPNPKGWTMMSLFRQLPYDVLVTGNHELYRYEGALSSLTGLADYFKAAYLSSNVNVTLPSSEGGKSMPIGNRYRKFVTEQGRNVTALGILFDFKMHAPGITVQPPTDLIHEQWFQDVISDRPSLFLLVGHMSVRAVEADSKWRFVVAAIRRVHPDVPIAVFGGHHHIRDCVMEDKASMSLASGRYMETIGWMSISNLTSKSGPSFARRYLDQNRNTYAYHAGDDFDSPRGTGITERLEHIAEKWNLTHSFGVAPRSYFLNRYPAYFEASVFNLMTQKVLPLLVDRPDRGVDHITILNTGSIRFDIYRGNFTRNDQWNILPFANNFSFIHPVRRSVANKLLAYLNVVGEHQLLPSSSSSTNAEGEVEQAYSASLARSYAEYWGVDRSAEGWEADARLRESAVEAQSSGKSKLTTGYVTYDDCPGEPGDDTLHKPFPYTTQGWFVATNLTTSTVGATAEEDDEVDVVFFDFIATDITMALNVLQKERTYLLEDAKTYVTGLTANTLMQEYAERAWN